ncbi:MAG: hypothetical protein Q4D41_12550 [Prevotellaceae bacterium]|nr:hypothetical protein [Prevotellaceae bacterium]
MKKKINIFIICLMAAMVLSANAQDVIVKRDGSTILSKVMEIGTSEVKYKKWSNQDGPLYAISKTELLSINYQNGEKDDFSNISTNSQISSTNEQGKGEIEVPFDKDLNKRIIASCNTDNVVFSNDKEKEDKQAKIFWASFYAKDDAQFVNDEIELKYEMYPVIWNDKKNVYEKPTIKYNFSNTTASRVVNISVKNKTDKTIFIDLGNTFFIRGEESSPYYVPSATSTTKGSSTGASVNLGSVAGALGVGGAIGSLASGVNVGGSKSSESTTVTYSQRVISIPPMSTKQLDMQLLLLDDKKNAHAMITSRRYTYLDINCNRGESKTFTYETSPIKFGAYLTYSSNEDFSNYSHISTRFYLAKAIGGRYDMFRNIKTKDFTGNLYRENNSGYTDGFYFIAEYIDM